LHVALEKAVELAAVMDNPVDLINAAIETLIRERCELPPFETLDRLVRRARNLANERIFASINAKCPDPMMFDALLERKGGESRTDFNRLKEDAPNATYTHFKELIERFRWLTSLGDVGKFIVDVPEAKIRHFTAEASVLDASEMKDFTAPKRRTLLFCLIHQARAKVTDDLVSMFCKRISSIENSSQATLIRLQEENKGKSEQMFLLVREVAEAVKSGLSDADAMTKIRDCVTAAGGPDSLIENCEILEGYSNNNILPFLGNFYKNCRSFLFDFLEVLDFRSTTQDESLIDALKWIRENKGLRKETIPASLCPDISFASEKWQKFLWEKNEEMNRRSLEICVFFPLRDELRSGDIAVTGSEEYGDYREQLIPEDECRQLLEGYCDEAGLPSAAEPFVDSLKNLLQTASDEADKGYAENKNYELNSKGILKLKRRRAEKISASTLELEKIIRQRMPERSILEILRNTDQWTSWTRHFGPLSGSDPKLLDPIQRYILTAFTWGCNLGPEQAARHMKGLVSARALSYTNQRHCDIKHLESAGVDLQNRIQEFELTYLWGDGSTAAADGTKYDMYRRNLMAEYHIRYGGWGGIAYYHVADNYVAIFSHFIPCGVWEAVYILDGLLENLSDISPHTLYSDTQGQSAPVFALAYLLGIKLMPRIRNLKELIFYKADKDVHYENVEALFLDGKERQQVIDWKLMQTHWFDMMRVVLSIRKGKISTATLLRKLGNYSRKNKLYQTFRELGRVVRTEFLLQYIQDMEMREKITAGTNKAEAYNGFAKWVFFGDDGIISTNNRAEQEKCIKYNQLVANAIILQNVADQTAIIQDLLEEGYPVTKEALASISPFVTESRKRFGDYSLDMAISENAPENALGV
jgi:TnpA family transposase